LYRDEEEPMAMKDGGASLVKPKAKATPKPDQVAAR